MLGADVADALAAGASDGLAGAWGGVELAARARSLLSTRRRLAEALAQARTEGREAEGVRRIGALDDALPQMVWKADAAGVVTCVNRRWIEYTGLDLESAARGGWLAAVHPDDAIEGAARWLCAVHAGEDYEACYRLRRGDGAYRWHLGRASPQRDTGGRVLGWVGTATEVDQQKRAQITLDLLARAGQALAEPLDVRARIAALARLVVPELGDFCGVYLVGERGEVRLAEAAAVDPEHVRIARDRIARLGASTATHRVTEVVQSGRSTLCAVVTDADHAAMAADAEDLAALRCKGTRSWLCVPMAARGRVLGALALGRSADRRRYDDADLAQAEELGRRAAVAIDNAQLFEMVEREQRSAEEAARLKDEFLANLNHELRTPLTAILGWARMLRTHALPEEKRARALERIERNSVAQARLVEDLLDASRILARTMVLEPASVDVALVVETVVAALRPDCEAKRVALRAVIDPAVGLIQADEGRLRQVVEKLLSNAVKFTPPGGSIAVRVEHVRAPERARISVTDTGVGISAAFLPHVFDRFRQADGSTTRAHGGLGLGLAIAHHIVALHGGTIDGPQRGRGPRGDVRRPPPRRPALSPPHLR